jgi:uncharacterized membrane protein
MKLPNLKNLNEQVLKKKFWKLEVADYLVILMVVIYVAIFSHFIILRHLSFRSNAWDLGILTQSIASTSRGKLFAYNVEPYYSPTGSYFGIHFTPILFTIVPFFSLIPQVETILILQSIILALGSVPAYLIAKHYFDNRVTSLLLSISYLLNPALQGINWYDFTPQVFFPLLILSTTYFLKKRKPLFFLLFMTLTLMTIEQAAYFVALYAVYAAWELREDVKKLFSPTRNLFSFLPLIALAIVIVWIIFSSSVQSTLNPNPPKELLALNNYKILEVDSIAEIPAKALTNPDLVLKAIRYDLPHKLLYALMIFAPSGFVAFLSPVAILPSLLWFFLSFLSNWPPYYQIGFQYLVFTMPFIFVATIEGLKNISKFVDKKLVKKFLFRFPLLLVLVGLILSVFASPLSFIHQYDDFSYFRDYGITSPSSLDRTVIEILDTIPDDASVITTPIVFPHVSTNLNAYVIPPLNSPSPGLFAGNLEYLKSIKHDYILLTYYWNLEESDILYNEFIKDTDTYGLFVQGPGLELYKKGYEGDPQKVSVKFSYKELITANSIVVDDSSSESGKVFELKKSSIAERIAWFGPYVTLTPGNYTANFRIKVDRILDEKIVVLDVWSNSLKDSNITSYTVFGDDLSKSLMWQTFSLPFTVTERSADVEFRGLEATGNATIWSDYVEVIPE